MKQRKTYKHTVDLINLLSNLEMTTEDIFSLYNCECIHNDLDCRYRDNGRCTIKKKM